jgi:hypothetical protein
MFELHSDYLLLLLLHYAKLNNILSNVIGFKLTKLTNDCKRFNCSS